MIRLIAAIDRRRGLAKQGFQPWYIPDDEVFFTEKTKSQGGIVLVGSTTFKTFRGPLEARTNYVLTHDKQPIEGASIVDDLTHFLKQYQDSDLWVVGGANVFAQVMSAGQADELYLTTIDADFGCNQFFPDYSKGYALAQQSDLREQNGFIFRYQTYTKQT